jgi:Tfp pilus assembly protein FimT
MKPCCAGLTLLEMMLCLGLYALLLLALIPPLQWLTGASRLEASVQNLVSVLNFARSEALRGGREVYLCGIMMRRNQRLNRCREDSANGPLPWRQGVLVFANPTGDSLAHYDTREDLRDVAFHDASVTVRASREVYRIRADGSYVSGRQPWFSLSETLSARCVTVQMAASSFWPVVCRAACPGCP